MRCLAAVRAASAVVLLFALDCTKKQPKGDTAFLPDLASDLGPVVARVGGVPIFSSQVVAQAEQLAVPPRAALDQLIRFHLLAERARAAGLWTDALRSNPPHQLMVQRLLEREHEPHARPEHIPEKDLRDVYARNIDQFVHPRLVKVGVISIWTGARMKADPRARRQKAASELWTQLSSRMDKRQVDLGVLANQPAWSGLASVRELWQGLDKPLGPEIGRAIQDLKRPGDLTGLLQDETGFHIARYIDERPSENRSFESVSGELRARFFPTWKASRFLEFERQLQSAHTVETFTSRLASTAPVTKEPLAVP